MIELLKKWWAYAKSHPVLMAVIAIVALAAYFRLWQLWSLPPGLHPDEAANGLDIIERIKQGDLRAVYNTNGPRESLFFFLQAIFVFTLGNTILALRLAPALLGVLAVLVTYLWMSEWFTKRTALFAGLFMATGSWVVTMSRDGYRASMLPLMIALTAWLVTKAIKLRKWYWYVGAGVAYGAGFYTYLSWRLTPFVWLIILVAAAIKYRKQWKAWIKPALIFGLSASLVLVPLGYHALKNPADIIGRASVSFTNPELNGGQPLQTLGKTIVQTALMFNWKGDPNYRHNLGGAPMLNALVGVFFLLGALLSLRRIKDLRYFSLLLILAVMLVPEILTAEGIPHGLRAIGAIPIVYILAAIGLSEMVSRWRGIFPKNPIAHSLLVVVIAASLLASVAYDYHRYFVAWANAPETYEAYAEDAVQAANYLNQHPFDGNRYVVIDGYSNITVKYLTAGKASYDRIEKDFSKIDSSKPAQIVVLQTQAQSAQAYLQNLAANYRVVTVTSEDRPHKLLFTAYEPK